MLGRYLIVWLVLLSALAYAWPISAAGGFDPFVAGAPGLQWMIAGIMFALGSMLPADEVRQVLVRWPNVLCGTALQYISMPLLALSAAWLFQLQGPWFVGMVIVGCVPGAMASNVLTHLARGNVSYSVSLTTAATLLSPLIVPVTLSLALSDDPHITLNPLTEAQRLLLTVVMPVTGGHILSRLSAEFRALVQPRAPVVANLLLLWVIATVVALNREHLAPLSQACYLAATQAEFAGLAGPLALACVNVGGYLTGYFGGMACRLPEPERRALTIEIGMQNAGLGAVLALKIMPDRPEVAILPALYMLGCMVSGTLLAQIWRCLAPIAPPGPTSQ